MGVGDGPHHPHRLLCSDSNGPGDVQRAKISFGFYPFTAGIPTFYDLGSEVIDIADGATQEVSIAWTPPALPAGEEHGCILVTIDYGYDRSFRNRSNAAQKNVQVQDTSSPATFDFRVENTLPARATVRLRVENQLPDWDIRLSDTQFVAEVQDCTRVVHAVVTPTASPPRQREALFFVTAEAAPFGTEEFVDIGGVALKARYRGTSAVGGSTTWIVPLIAILVAAL